MRPAFATVNAYLKMLNFSKAAPDYVRRGDASTMPGNDNLPIDYPDVLGMITGGVRLNVEALQCAFAVHPRSTAVNQPFEALVLLQNICNRPLSATITIRLPRKDGDGNRLNLLTPKEIIPLTLQSGEMGVLHIPIVPAAPTQPGLTIPIGVRIENKTPRGAKLIRAVEGGRAASMLKMSTHRLNILREVNFIAESPEAGALVDAVSIIPGQVAAAPVDPAPRYETLWSEQDLPQEQAKYAQLIEQARQFAGSITRLQVLQPLTSLTMQRFSQAGLTLFPSEALMIAKTLTYAMEDGLETEDGFKLATSRWFAQLLNVVADPAITSDMSKLLPKLYIDVVHDSVRLGLSMVQRISGADLGTRPEHISYANEVVTALEGKASVDLSHAYLPLILTGMMLNAEIKLTRESLWDNLTQIKEAWQSRLAKTTEPFEWLAKVFSDFHYRAEAFLNEQRIPRPNR